GRGLKPLKGSPPKDFGLEEMLVNTPEGSSFFDQVARMLPKHLTETGAPGRDVLQEFLHRTNIKAELMSMVTADPIDHPDSSWRRSDPLIKGPASTPLDLFRQNSAIEMRAVARQVEIIEEIEDTDDRKHTSALLDWDNSKAARTDTWTAKRRGALSVFAGTFVTAGKFIVTLGGLVSVSRDRSWSSKFKRETGIRFEHDFGGKLVRYRTVYQLQVRVLGRPPVFLEGDLVGTQVATRERALASGIVEPGPQEHAPQYRKGDDRTHFAPAHLESGLSTAGAKVHSFRGKDRIYGAIADTLRKVPNHRWYHFSSSEFIKYFDDPDLAAGLKSLVNDTTRRQRNAKARMSDKQLMQLVDLMLGPGLVVPLVKQGPFTDTVVMVRIKATLEGLADGDLQIDLADSTTETRTKEYETRTFTASRNTSASLGAQGRITSAIIKGANVFLATLKVGRTWSSAVTLANDTGKVTEHKHAGIRLTESGGQNETALRHFAGDLRLTPEVTTYTRTNKMLRKISFGKPGRHGLDVRPVALDGEFTGLTRDQHTPLGQTVPVELLIPDHLVTTGQAPDTIVITPSPARALPPGTLIDGLPKGERTVEGADVLTVAGTEHIVDSVYRMLDRASGDPAFAQRTGNNAELITDQFSPEAFRKDPRIFGKVHVVEGIGHERRRADVRGRAGVVLKPINPRRLGPEEYQRTKNTYVSGTAVSMAKGATTSVDFDLTNVDAISGTANPVAGGRTGAPEGVFIFSLAPWAARFGRKRAQRIQGIEKNHFTPNPSKRILISVGVEASVVAETQRRGNVDLAEIKARPPLGSAGETFTLNDSVLMWVTEEQLAELERQDRERTGADLDVPDTDSSAGETPEDERLPAPESMRNPNVTSLGVGGVADRIDISEALDDLRTKITAHPDLGAEAAAQLLPSSPLTSSHNNTRVVTELLSNVDRMFTTVMNGGVGTPLRVEFRWSGRTYVFTVEGEWTTLPTEGEIEIVRKMAARNIVSVGDTDEKVFGQNIVDVSAVVRAHGQFSDPGTAADGSKSSQPNSGNVGVGLRAGYVALAQTHTESYAHSQSAGSYGAVRGPVGSYEGVIKLTAKIERKLGFDEETKDDTTSGPVISSVVDKTIKVRAMPEEKLLPPSSTKPLGAEGDIESLPASDAENIAEWRQDADESLALPDSGQYEVEHYFGMIKTLRAAAKVALANSGVTVDTKVSLAIDAAITPATVKAGMPAMRAGLFRFPVAGLDRDVEFHARLKPGAKLASASGRVEMDSFTGDAASDSVELTSGSEYSTGGILRGNAGTDHAGGTKENFGSVQTLAVIDKSGPSNRSDKTVDINVHTEATSSRDPRFNHRTTHPGLSSRGVLADVEFKVVATKPGSTSKVGVAGVNVDNAYLVRMREPAAEQLLGPLPEPLVKAVSDFTAASKAWTDAVGAVEGALSADANADVTELQGEADDAKTAWWDAMREYHRQLRLAQEAGEVGVVELVEAQEIQPVAGVLRPVPAPAFLAGVDQNALPSDTVTSFFSSLNVVNNAPAAVVAPTPVADSVISDGGRDLPKIVHVPVLGGPVVDSAWESLAVTAETARREGWTPVLVTDVPRSLFVAARAGDPYLADLLRMDRKAREHGFLVVDVDEVFNADSPMVEQDLFSAANDNTTDENRDLARALLGAELTRRFGGVVVSAEHALTDTGAFAAVVSSAGGYALAPATPATDVPPVLVVPRGHRFAGRYARQLRDSVRTGRPGNATDLAFRAARGLGPVPVVRDATEFRGGTEDTTGTPTLADLVDLVGSTVETLTKGLRARGDLDFALVHRKLRKHPHGALVLEAAVATIAREQAWRDMVRTVTLPDRRPGARDVAAEASKWLDIDPEPRPNSRGVTSGARFHVTEVSVSDPDTELGTYEAAAELTLKIQQGGGQDTTTDDATGPITLADDARTLDLALQIRDALRDGIANRDGTLALDTAVELANRHERPGVVLRAAVSAVAADPADAGRVRTVTMPPAADPSIGDVLDL
ncbi:MAG: large repetitive protein, partial [Pseudonocardiales bacterium]|nr:large repetitive protein [Pseudonocardiales bacterium]